VVPDAFADFKKICTFSGCHRNMKSPTDESKRTKKYQFAIEMCISTDDCVSRYWKQYVQKDESRKYIETKQSVHPDNTTNPIMMLGRGTQKGKGHHVQVHKNHDRSSYDRRVIC